MEKGVIFCLCAANLGRWIRCQNSFKKNLKQHGENFLGMKKVFRVIGVLLR